MKEKLNQIVKRGFEENLKIKSEILNSELISQIVNTSIAIVGCLKNKSKIFFAGNGGSFADSQHLAANLFQNF